MSLPRMNRLMVDTLTPVALAMSRNVNSIGPGFGQLGYCLRNTASRTDSDSFNMFLPGHYCSRNETICQVLSFRDTPNPLTLGPLMDTTARCL